MLPDLERLIRLQQLANTAADARRKVVAIPSRVTELEDRLAASAADVDTAKARLTGEKQRRQGTENDLAKMQSRLSKFKEQLMAVKTNKEYTAVQHEIATAETDVQQLEDTLLEQMLEIDDLTAAVKTAIAALAATTAEVEEARTEIDTERSALEQIIAGAVDERGTLTETIGVQARRLFDAIAVQRGGIAVVEARDGHCSVCNVRLRPQMFNDIRMNTELIQCESCMRILYHSPESGRETAPAGEPTG